MIYKVTFEDADHNPIKEVTLAADSLIEAGWMLLNSTAGPPDAHGVKIEEIPPADTPAGEPT